MSQDGSSAVQIVILVLVVFMPESWNGLASVGIQVRLDDIVPSFQRHVQVASGKSKDKK